MKYFIKYVKNIYKILRNKYEAETSRRRRSQFTVGLRKGQRRSELCTAVYVSNLARIGAKICENAFRTISEILFFDPEKIAFEKFSHRNNYFSQILRGFGRRTAKRTAPSARASNFVLDTLILRSVRPKFHPITSHTVRRHMSFMGNSACSPWEPPCALLENQQMSSVETRNCLH